MPESKRSSFWNFFPGLMSQSKYFHTLQRRRILILVFFDLVSSDSESFSNPLAPSGFRHHGHAGDQAWASTLWTVYRSSARWTFNLSLFCWFTGLRLPSPTQIFGNFWWLHELTRRLLHRHRPKYQRLHTKAVRANSHPAGTKEGWLSFCLIVPTFIFTSIWNIVHHTEFNSYRVPGVGGV